jgi:hypothetical protein
VEPYRAWPSNRAYDGLFDAGDVDISLGKCRSGRIKGTLPLREPWVWIGQPWAMETATMAVPLIHTCGPARRAMWPRQRCWRLGRPRVVVAGCANLFGVLATVKAGIGVFALGRNFVPRGFAEIAPEVGLPPLGILDYVIDCRVGMFRSRCGCPRRRAAWRCESACPLTGGSHQADPDPSSSGQRPGQRPCIPTSASTGAHAAQPRPTAN